VGVHLILELHQSDYLGFHSVLVTGCCGVFFPGNRIYVLGFPVRWISWAKILQA
jgi:hypothetical protein